jgi:hypothetical protein
MLLTINIWGLSQLTTNDRQQFQMGLNNSQGMKAYTINFLMQKYPNDDPFNSQVRFESIWDNPKLFNDLICEMIIGMEGMSKYALQSICGSATLANKIYTTIYHANKQRIDTQISLRKKQLEKEAIEDSLKKDKEAREEKKKKELEILQEKINDSIYYSTPHFGKVGLSQFRTPAEFPGGLIAFQKYIEYNINRDVPVINKAPSGKYTVYVTFTIDIDGTLKDIRTENDPGYGTKEEAIRVFKKSPPWIPASEKGHKVLFWHKQGVTFIVGEE